MLNLSGKAPIVRKVPLSLDISNCETPYETPVPCLMKKMGMNACDTRRKDAEGRRKRYLTSNVLIGSALLSFSRRSLNLSKSLDDVGEGWPNPDACTEQVIP